MTSTAVLAPVIAIFGAALTALLTYALSRRAARRERRARAFGEALSVIEDYAEMPYRIRRRPGTLEGRHQLTEATERDGLGARDDEVIEAAAAAGITMYFTGERHFFH